MNLCICGALGRMGKNVYDIANTFSEINVVCGIDFNADTKTSSLPFPVYKTFDEIKEKVDVIIDFSNPASLDGLLGYAIKNKVGAVLCTTGYNENQIEEINKASKKTAIFKSANMSMGINLLINLVKKAAEFIPDFDVEIIEKHHNQKVDAPSGTALMLASAVKEVNNDKYFIYGREGKVGKRDKNEIGIHAIRGGNIVGEHQVIFAGNDETITLTHEATDRKVFAMGAIKASLYISKKDVGLFNMQDMID